MYSNTKNPMSSNFTNKVYAHEKNHITKQLYSLLQVAAHVKLKH